MLIRTEASPLLPLIIPTPETLIGKQVYIDPEAGAVPGIDPPVLFVNV